mmetsp:Transcript_14039/g.41475  ORF Transcript_14039/g.41475 Transcript_14039/m.41475 type:complete len:272 (-) Transcript_14039:77-892(-)
MTRRRCDDALIPPKRGRSRSAASLSAGSESSPSIDAQSEIGLERSSSRLSERKPECARGSDAILLPLKLSASRWGSEASGATPSHEARWLSSSHSVRSAGSRSQSRFPTARPSSPPSASAAPLAEAGSSETTPLAQKWSSARCGIAEAMSSSCSHAMPVRLRQSVRSPPRVAPNVSGSASSGCSGNLLRPSQWSRGSWTAMSRSGCHSLIGLPSRSSSSMAPHAAAIAPCSPAPVTPASGRKTRSSRWRACSRPALSAPTNPPSVYAVSVT